MASRQFLTTSCCRRSWLLSTLATLLSRRTITFAVPRAQESSSDTTSSVRQTHLPLPPPLPPHRIAVREEMSDAFPRVCPRPVWVRYSITRRVRQRILLVMDENEVGLESDVFVVDVVMGEGDRSSGQGVLRRKYGVLAELRNFTAQLLEAAAQDTRRSDR
jgi:hypothetical protein